MLCRIVNALERIAVALESIAEKPPMIICASMDDAIEEATQAKGGKPS